MDRDGSEIDEEETVHPSQAGCLDYPLGDFVDSILFAEEDEGGCQRR